VNDRIHKTAVLRAPLARVWRAVSDAAEFGAWFGVRFDGPFVAGAALTGRIQPTTVDPEVAKLQGPHAGTPLQIFVERLEAPRLLSFRWHPFGVQEGADTKQEPTTLVVFELTEVAGGTRLDITESGFDRLPPERRGPAFAANEGGWQHQLGLVARYVQGHA